MSSITLIKVFLSAKYYAFINRLAINLSSKSGIGEIFSQFLNPIVLLGKLLFIPPVRKLGI